MSVVVTTLEAEQYAAFGLPAPVHNWIPYRYHFNELDFGAGTPFIVEYVKGMIGFDSSSSDVRIETGPGSIPGLLTLNPKVIEIRIKCDAKRGIDVQQKLDTLLNAFVLPSRPYNVWVGDFLNRGYFTERTTYFRYMRPGWSEPRVLYCRATKVSVDSEYALSTGLIDMVVQLTAPDPISYGYHTHIVKIPSGQSYSFNMNGSHLDGYAPLVRLTGNLVNPSIRRTFVDFYHPFGKTQRVTFNLRWNSGLNVDFRNRATDPQGAALVLSDQEFFTVKKGEQTLSYVGGGQADFLFRAVWQS